MLDGRIIAKIPLHRYTPWLQCAASCLVRALLLVIDRGHVIESHILHKTRLVLLLNMFDLIKMPRWRVL